MSRTPVRACSATTERPTIFIDLTTHADDGDVADFMNVSPARVVSSESSSGESESESEFSGDYDRGAPATPFAVTRGAAALDGKSRGSSTLVGQLAMWNLQLAAELHKPRVRRRGEFTLKQQKGEIVVLVESAALHNQTLISALCEIVMRATTPLMLKQACELTKLTVQCNALIAQLHTTIKVVADIASATDASVMATLSARMVELLRSDASEAVLTRAETERLRTRVTAADNQFIELSYAANDIQSTLQTVIYTAVSEKMPVAKARHHAHNTRDSPPSSQSSPPPSVNEKDD